MEWILLVAIILIVVFIALRRAGEPGTLESEPYKIRKLFLSPAERSFYGVLEQAIADQWRLHTKVRVADVLQPNVSGNRSSWQRAFNKISAKHFDFILCDPSTLQVKVVIELNDKSHKKAATEKRDQFLANACQSASLPLVFFDAKSQYSIEQIREKLAGL